MDYKPYAISWNTTYRCNLRCSHCYLDTNALTNQSVSELSTREGYKLIDQMAELNPNLLLILTGGEPLLRKDIYDLSSYANPCYPAFLEFLCDIIVDHIPVCSQYYHHSLLRGIRG